MHSSTDDKLKAHLLLNMSGVYREKGNYSKEMDCLQESVKLGNIRATISLALCYHDGIGVPVNIEKCKQLLRKCAAQNEDIEVREEAKKYLREIK